MKETVRLDPTTLRACAAIARSSADNVPNGRAHHHVAAGALSAFAETLDAMSAIEPCELAIEVRG